MRRKVMSAEARLEHLVVEVRAQHPRHVDWDTLEPRLLERLEAQPRSRPQKGRRRFVMPLMLASAAAATLVGILAFGENPHGATADAGNAAVASVTAKTTNDASTDGHQLQVGERVVAASGGVAVRHAGLAEWSLAPGSSAEVKAREPALVIQLQCGKLIANVAPSLESESFVVEVGGARVAVHGTRFSVSRSDGHAVVDVSEGVVAVGPLGAPARALLTGPASVKVVATGEQAGSLVEKRGDVRYTAAHEPSRTKAPAAVDPAPTAKPESLPQEPTFEEVERGLARVEGVLGSCLEQHTHRRGNVELSLDTRVTFRVEPDGALSRYRFTPPLAPRVAECAHAGFASIRFAPTVTGSHIIRDLHIQR